MKKKRRKREKRSVQLSKSYNPPYFLLLARSITLGITTEPETCSIVRLLLPEAYDNVNLTINGLLFSSLNPLSDYCCTAYNVYLSLKT